MELSKKFSAMVDNETNGNIADFKHELKKLNKADLLKFAVYCATYGYLDIYEIEKYFNS